jgi:hypothetical protein
MSKENFIMWTLRFDSSSSTVNNTNNTDDNNTSCVGDVEAGGGAAVGGGENNNENNKMIHSSSSDSVMSTTIPRVTIPLEKVEQQFSQKNLPWKIRLMRAEDIPAVVELEKARALETTGEVLCDEAVRRGFALAWASPELARVWICEMEEFISTSTSNNNNGNSPPSSTTASGWLRVSRIIGMCAVTNEMSEWKGQLVKWCTSIFIIPSMRRRGVFTSLIQFVRSVALNDKYCCALRLQTIGENSVFGNDGDHKEISRLQSHLATKLGFTEEHYFLMRKATNTVGSLTTRDVFDVKDAK